MMKFPGANQSWDLKQVEIVTADRLDKRGKLTNKRTYIPWWEIL